MLKEFDRIKVHVLAYPSYKEIETRNYGRVFLVHKHPKTKKLCIEWNGEPTPCGCDENALVPLEYFSWNVVFENVETGDCCYHSTAHDCFVPCTSTHSVILQEVSANG